MCEVKCTIEPGLIDSERVAIIRTAEGGSEEVTVSSRAVTERGIKAALIGKSGERLLIELPREAASGRWRLWVTADNVVG